MDIKIDRKLSFPEIKQVLALLFAIVTGANFIMIYIYSFQSINVIISLYCFAVGLSMMAFEFYEVHGFRNFWNSEGGFYVLHKSAVSFCNKVYVILRSNLNHNKYIGIGFLTFTLISTICTFIKY